MTKEKEWMIRKERRKSSIKVRRRKLLHHKCLPERGLRRQRLGYRKLLSEAGCPGFKELRLNKGRLRLSGGPGAFQSTLLVNCDLARQE